MLNQKEIAEVYRLGLIIGMFEVKEVINWADSVIAAEASPDYGLIEVSMAGDANEGKMASLLQAVGGEADPKTAPEIIFGLLGRRLAADPEAADTIRAQVKAIVKSEGRAVDPGDDLAVLGKLDARAEEWAKRAGK